jgi:hypothetical protein
MYRNGFGDEYKKNSVSVLKEALKMWQEYAGAASRNYNPQFMAKTRTIDWNGLTKNVKNDIEIVKQSVRD